MKEKVVVKDFKDIKYRKVNNNVDYENIRKDVERAITVDSEVDYLKVLDWDIDLQNEIADFEYSRTCSLSIHFPIAVMIPSVVLGIVAAYLLVDGFWGLGDAVCVMVLMAGFIAYLIKRSRYILNVHSNNILFRHTIKKILERMIEQ